MSEETVVFALAPPSGPDDYLYEVFGNGHPVSVYDPELENPYAVENAAERVENALEALPKEPHEYDLHDGVRWVRFDYQSLVEDGREPVRLDRGEDE